MNRLRIALGRLVRAEHGQDLAEYAMLAALIAIAATGAVTTMGQQIKNVLWNVIASTI
jgi:Flp pilus assembly pilin Flp